MVELGEYLPTNSPLNTMLTKETLVPLVNTVLTPDQRTDVLALISSTPELCEKYGDLFEWTRDAILDMLNPNTVQYLCTVEGLNQMRKRLLEDGDTQVERIAVEQIITAHLQAARTGLRLESIEPTDEMMNQSKFWIRAHNLAQSRIMRATHSLMRLRKAKADLELKLRKNRPPYYDKSDYLKVTEDVIRSRQEYLQDEAQEAYELRMIRQHAAREERQSEAKVAQEAKKSSLEKAWEQFLAKKKREAQTKKKQNQVPSQSNSSPNLQTCKPPVSIPSQNLSQEP